METSVRKVRVLENDGVSLLVKVEDEYGNDFHILRKRVHLIGTEYFITSERQAQLGRGAIARQKAREVKRLAKEKLAREEKAAELKTEVAA